MSRRGRAAPDAGFGYLLEVAMKIEACGAFLWKAAYHLGQLHSEGHAWAPWSSCSTGRRCCPPCTGWWRQMGASALGRAHPIENFLREAAVLSLYEAGNIGM